MSADEVTPLDEQCAAWLADFEEALAAGSPTQPEPAVAPELRRRLQRGQALLRLLNQAWPRLPPPDPGADPAAAGPRDIGRFRVVRELGRGGGGIVFLAHDPQLGRDVALKVPRADILLDADSRARFLREARAAAGLDHPNVVAGYEAGEGGAAVRGRPGRAPPPPPPAQAP